MNTTQAPQQAMPQYEITEADKKRVKKIAEALEAFEGDLTPPLKKTNENSDEPDMNVMGNEVWPAVWAVVDFVFGEELEINVGQDDPKDAQKFLDDIWGRKERRIPLLMRWLMNGDMAGRAFLRIVPGKKKDAFRLIEVDPAIVFVKTAPQDCQTVLLYCLEYCEEEKKTNGQTQKTYYREEISRVDPEPKPEQYEDTNADGLDDDVTWSIQHWTKISDKGQWQAAGEPIPWPYDFPPIFSNQNLPKPNDFWGYSGVTKGLIGINNAINFVNSNINVTGKIQRLLYAGGVGESEIDVIPGKIIQLPYPENKIESVNLQSDAANSRAFAGDLRGESERLSGVPLIASGYTANMPNGNIPGITMRLMFQSLLKKMNRMRCLYGETIIEVSKALLVLAGFTDKIEITLGWQDPLPSEELHEIQAAIALGELGVSKTTRMRRLGYDPVEEAKLCAEEAARDAALAPTLPESIPGVPALPGQPKPAPMQPGQQPPQQDTQQQNGQVPVGQKAGQQ